MNDRCKNPTTGTVVQAGSKQISREPTLTRQTTLDVTRYARLWRLAWWTQHVAWPLAGIGYAAKLAQEGDVSAPGPGRISAQTLYYQTMFTFAMLVGFVSLLLLALRGIATLLLWRHRLRPELARTELMTRSLGVNLTIPQFVWSRPSPAGFAMHACILLVSGALAYLF